MLFKQDFDTAKKYWRAFWEKEVLDRPLVCVKAPKKGIEPAKFSFAISDCYKACMNNDFENYLKSYDAYASSMYFGGEAMPALELSLGPDQYGGFLGCNIESPGGAADTWAHPVVKDFSNFEVKIDKSFGGYFDNLKRFLEYAADFSKDRFLLSMIDLHGNMDALSALRGPGDLCLDIMDCPDEVHRVLNDVRKTYDDVFQMIYKSGDMKNRGSISWVPTYCETGKFAVVQCDFSCFLSPAQVREFVIPSIAEEAAYLDRSVYHFDGVNALGHLDDILAIKEIDAFQWVPGDGKPRSIEWMDLLKKVQKSGKSLWIFDWTIEEIKAHFKELEPNKVVFSVGATSQDEADELLEYLCKNM